jgi:hypothetical protein
MTKNDFSKDNVEHISAIKRIVPPQALWVALEVPEHLDVITLQNVAFRIPTTINDVTFFDNGSPVPEGRQGTTLFTMDNRLITMYNMKHNDIEMICKTAGLNRLKVSNIGLYDELRKKNTVKVPLDGGIDYKNQPIMVFQ